MRCSHPARGSAHTRTLASGAPGLSPRRALRHLPLLQEPLLDPSPPWRAPDPAPWPGPLLAMRSLAISSPLVSQPDREGRCLRAQDSCSGRWLSRLGSDRRPSLPPVSLQRGPAPMTQLGTGSALLQASGGRPYHKDDADVFAVIGSESLSRV